MKTSFSYITPVLLNTAFVDTVLNKTQIRTPKVVHPKYSISKIRAFYMSKVRHAGGVWVEIGNDSN